jgi:protein-S-isoprenylcysteine O-methyltransferase Ste14
LAVVLAAIAWLVYYVGNTVLLGSGLNRWLIRRLGEERALAGYNAVMGVTFGLQAAVHGAVNAAFADTMGVPNPRIWMTCGLLVMAAGLLVKIWATSVTSLGTYYYNDMFLGRPLEACPEYVERGPYRVFRNPMYGVGNLSAYGGALLALSWQGLVLAAVFQASIFAFHWLVERPFVMRVYVAPRRALDQ